MEIEILKKEAQEWKNDIETRLIYWIKCKDEKERIVEYHYPHLFYIGSRWFSCQIWKNGRGMYASARYKNLPEKLYGKTLEDDIKNEHRKLYGRYYIDALKKEIEIIEEKILERKKSGWDLDYIGDRLKEAKELLSYEEQLLDKKTESCS